MNLYGFFYVFKFGTQVIPLYNYINTLLFLSSPQLLYRVSHAVTQPHLTS